MKTLKELYPMMFKKKYNDLAEKKALSKPIIMWRFCAYKNEINYKYGDYYFMKDFFDFDEMKSFSAKHSEKEKPLYTNYNSNYWKIETNIK